MPKTLLPELVTMGKIAALMAQHDDKEQNRIMEWLCQKFPDNPQAVYDRAVEACAPDLTEEFDA